MKKQKKIKKILRKNIFFVMISFFIVGMVFGAFTTTLITPQVSTGTGSNNSNISFVGTAGDEGYYVNDENNSSIIGNYFKGYYYDNLFGFFKLDWSSNPEDNVRIISSTSLCGGGYGYKLGGEAYSEISGHIDFNYNSTTFVYYCSNDGLLHGTAYGKYIGFQSFDGINIGIAPNVVSLIEKVNNTTLFINDTTDIEISTSISAEEIQTLGGDLIQIDPKKESIFYIVK